MPSLVGSAKTASASRYLQQLCKHWSHRFEVEFDAAHGRVTFGPDAALMLDATDDGLTLRIEADDAERADRMTGVVTEHLQRFAFREELSVEWSPAATPS